MDNILKVVVRNEDKYPYRNKLNTIGHSYEVHYKDSTKTKYFSNDNLPDVAREFIDKHLDNHSGYFNDYGLYDEYWYY